MRMTVTLLRKAGYSVTAAAAVAFSSATPAQTLGLSDTPLFLAAGVEPNLIMAIDDSGSMDNETLFPTNDGAAWWRTGASGSCTTATDNNSFVGCRNNSTGTSDIPAAGELNFNYAGGADGNWKKYVYLFPNGLNSAQNSARRRAGDSTNDHFAIPPIAAFAWSRSADYNASYFDPSATYLPWANNGDYEFSDSNPEAARFDPVFQSTLALNLKQDVAGETNADPATACTSLTNTTANHFNFRVYTGMTLPVGTCMRRGTNAWEQVTEACAVNTNNGCHSTLTANFSLASGSNVAIRYFPATFYLGPDTQLPDDYGYTATPNQDGRAPNGSTPLSRYEIKRANFATDAQYDAAIQNFANWFTYYRKRHLALRAGLGQSFSDVTGVRVNGFTINSPQTVALSSIDDPGAREALYEKFYEGWVGSGGTPNRTAVARIITNFRRSDNNPPVIAECQKNFGMLFTDGFSNAPATNDGIATTNVDGDQGDPYQDTYAGSLADAVMDAYINRLRTDFAPDKVLVPNECSSADPDPSLDCNRDLHMNFYAVTLGAKGLLFDPDEDVDPYETPQAWPTQFFARHPSAVDDLWHATINGRGKLLNARSPQEISNKLNEVLSSIAEATSTAASAALNSGSITENSIIFQARFNSDGWTGELLSYRIEPTTGQLIANSARGATLPGSREIVTLGSNGQGMRFEWADIVNDPARILQLDPDNNLVEAQRMLEYLRGSSTDEGTDAGDYRVREDDDGPNKLGDIVSSAPLYVGSPAFRYRDNMEAQQYSTFVSDNLDRKPMVYVGANDGMLHAFYAGRTIDDDGDDDLGEEEAQREAEDALRGTEVFSYVPGAVFSKLRNLASQDYGHEFYVDGSPSMGDAFFSGSWHTVLAGGLNKGGQGIYALDVTDPDDFDPDSVLFEFTDADDVDLGFTYSQPSIAKLGDGKWYVIFGNGYNSMLEDSPDPANIPRKSQTGNAVLFLVALEPGANGTREVIKLDTEMGMTEGATLGLDYGNGLATPSVVDVNNDRVVDYVYGGDLYGNMWKFDVRASSPAAWEVAFDGAPLFTARSPENEVQPITVRPEIARGPNGNGQMVLFGTGKYLEAVDRTITPQVTQSFYGIIDRNSVVASRSVLTEQQITREVSVTKDGTTSTVRVTSNNSLGANQGWYMDLLSPTAPRYKGERQVTNPTVRNGAVIFTTLIPDENPCNFGGTSWLMELDLLDGSRLETSAFDLNGDGLFDDDDNIEGDDADDDADDVPASGVQSQEGILQAPGIGDGTYGADGTAVQYKYLPGSTGNIQVIIENPGLGGTGRQSWRQIR